jgi:hypothetical protein
MRNVLFRSNKYIIMILGVLFLLVSSPRILFPDLDHGDDFADANILTAGNNFMKFGFIKCHFLEITDEQIDNLGSATTYTHYPPLNDILNGLWRIIFRTDSLRIFRIIALLFSFLGIIFWFFAVKNLTGSYTLSWLAAVFYMTNPAFIYGMDSIHQGAYAEAARSMILYFFIKAFADPGRRKKIFMFVVWCLCFIESLLTFEYIIFFGLFFILFGYFFKTGKRFPSWKSVLWLACAPVAAFLLHVIQNTWYFASFSLAIQDLTGIAVRRIAASTDAPPMNFYAWWNHVILRNFSLTFLFNYLFLFALLFFSYLLYHRLNVKSRKALDPARRLFILLTVCGISWYVAFPSHSWAHAFVGFLLRHLVPAASLAFAIFCYIVIRYIKENLSSRRYANVFLLFMIIMIVITGIGNSQLPVTPAKIKDSLEFIKFKECLIRLKQNSSPDDRVGVNYFRFPFMRYYTNRDCVVVFDKSALEAAATHPRFFIFMPYANQNTHDLYEYLLQSYIPLWQCDSSGFPAIFLKRKQ